MKRRINTEPPRAVQMLLSECSLERLLPLSRSEARSLFAEVLLILRQCAPRAACRVLRNKRMSLARRVGAGAAMLRCIGAATMPLVKEMHAANRAADRAGHEVAKCKDFLKGLSPAPTCVIDKMIWDDWNLDLAEARFLVQFEQGRAVGLSEFVRVRNDRESSARLGIRADPAQAEPGWPADGNLDFVVLELEPMYLASGGGGAGEQGTGAEAGQSSIDADASRGSDGLGFLDRW